MTTPYRLFLCASLAALAACGSSTAPTANQAAVTAPANEATQLPANEPVRANDLAPQNATPIASAVPDKATSCAAEIGKPAADKLVKTCLNVSPATHPPCNVANSCAMIRDEITRSCALFDGKGEPMKGCAPDPKGKEAAAGVVKLYYAALNARDYDTAWLQWGQDGPPNQPLPKFAAGFAKTRSTRVDIGTLPAAEGAAGSTYLTVPVTVDATLTDGTHQRFTGDYVVRRVNDVDGATPAQLRWHIDSAHLKPTRAG